MNVWKVLAGAATGVAVVVALPIAGPIGAITMVGAVAAGAAGAAGGAVADALDDSEEQAEERGEERGKEKERARNALVLEKLQERIHAIMEALKDWNQRGEQLVAMAAVGLACANCDGEIHPQERDDIDEFVAGVGHSELPSHVKERLDKLRREPPNLKTAFEIAKKAKVDPSILDAIIDVVMHADGRVHPNETAFMKAWHKMKSA